MTTATDNFRTTYENQLRHGDLPPGVSDADVDGPEDAPEPRPEPKQSHLK